MSATARRIGVVVGLLTLLQLPCAHASAEDVPPQPGPTLLGPSTANALPPQAQFKAGSSKAKVVAQHIAGFQLSQGATVTYENIKVQADGIDTTQTIFPDTKFSILDQCRLSSGPLGPSPTTVSIDTRSTQLPRIGFRSLLTPEAALIARQPVDPAHPLQAHYQIIMSHLGNFSGLMRHGLLWWPFEGWADRAQITFVSEVTARGLGTPRMEQLVLFGSPDPNGRPTEMKRLALGPAAIPTGSGGRISAAELRAKKQTYIFGPDGQLQDAFSDGDPQGFGDLVPTEKDEQPAPAPTPTPAPAPAK
jgi:hypothetical protein